MVLFNNYHVPNVFRPQVISEWHFNIDDTDDEMRDVGGRQGVSGNVILPYQSYKDFLSTFFFVIFFLWPPCLRAISQ